MRSSSQLVLYRLTGISVSFISKETRETLSTGSLLMSRGPGRIERAIAKLFARLPSETFTVAELAAQIYLTGEDEVGPDLIEKKHRVAILRAADKVLRRTGWQKVSMLSTGGNWPALFCNPLDPRSYLSARVRAKVPGCSREYAVAIVDRREAHWLVTAADRSRWEREHEAHRLDAAGEHDRAAELWSAIEAEQQAEVARVMNMLRQRI
jgi:hypothetical protein